MGQLHLAWYYTRSKKKFKPTNIEINENEWPKVTVQLPVYNEVYVIDRLIKGPCRSSAWCSIERLLLSIASKTFKSTEADQTYLFQ